MLNTHTAILPVIADTDHLPGNLDSFGLLHPPRLVRDVMIVEPDPKKLTQLRSAFDETTSIVACSTFMDARAALRTYAPILLVTNLRLGGYNGLHLVLLTAQFGTRSVVYISNAADCGLASEIRRFGAFHETEINVLRSLNAYVHGGLPDHERRERPGSDRRALPRGGRRASDEAASPSRP